MRLGIFVEMVEPIAGKLVNDLMAGMVAIERMCKIKIYALYSKKSRIIKIYESFLKSY